MRIVQVWVERERGSIFPQSRLVRKAVRWLPQRQAASKVGFSQVSVQRQRLLDFHERLLIRRRIVGIEVKRPRGVGLRQRRVRQREVRIQRHGPFVLLDGLGIVLWILAVLVVFAAEVVIVSLGINWAGGGERVLFSGEMDFLCYRVRDVVLEGEDVFQVALVGFAPDALAGP